MITFSFEFNKRSFNKVLNSQNTEPVRTITKAMRPEMTSLVPFSPSPLYSVVLQMMLTLKIHKKIRVLPNTKKCTAFFLVAFTISHDFTKRKTFFGVIGTFRQF